MRHLAPEDIPALLDGSLPPQDLRRVRDHLANGCVLCTAVIEEEPGGFLDVDTLARLLEAEDAPARAPTEAERAAIWSGVSRATSDNTDPRVDARPEEPQGFDIPATEPPEDASEAPTEAPTGAPSVPEPRTRDLRLVPPPPRLPDARPAPERRYPWLMPVVGLLAAALGLVVVLPRLGGESSPTAGLPTTEKGAGEEPAGLLGVGLRVVAGDVVNGKFKAKRRVVDGSEVRPDQVLVFELETAQASARYLFVVDARDRVDLLTPAEGAAAVEEPGRRRLAPGGQVVTLDVSEYASPITLVAAAAPAPLPAGDSVVDAWKRTRGRSGQAPEKLEYAPVTVAIAP